MRKGRHQGRMRRPLLDVSSNARYAPEVAWEAVARLIGGRRRGEVIESDPRAHEALRLLGGKAAYDAVASTPERIQPRFIGVYALLSEIADLMAELEEIVDGKEPVVDGKEPVGAVGAQGEADSNA